MKKSVALITIVFIVILNISATFAESLNLDAKSYVLIDKHSGQILYDYNGDKRIFPASTTKIVTAIVALELGKPDQVMTPSLAAVNDIGEGGSNIGILAGEKFTMKDLLKALLIRSANETANIIAENLCPTRQDFINLMNKKAKELGAKDTHFVNACGIHDDNHYTTANDLAKFTRYAMTIQTFRDIVSEKHLTMPVTGKHPSWPVMINTNKLLFSKSQYYTKVIGVKTGYTSQAGNNLISDAVNDKGMELIGVLIGAAHGEREEYSKELLEYGFKNFSVQSIIKRKEVVKSVKVADSSDKKALDLIAAKSLSTVLPNDKSKWDLKVVEHIKKNIEAPVKKGDIIGYIQYKRNGTILGKVDLTASKSVSKKFSAKVRDAFNGTFQLKFIIRLVIALIILAGILFVLKLVLKKYIKR